MENIILITGSAAYRDIQAISWGKLSSKYSIEIMQSPASTAAFLTKRQLQKIVDSISIKAAEIDYILVSGLIPWDLSEITGVFSSKLKKGPKFLVNLFDILKSTDLAQLSSIIPADKLLQSNAEEDLIEIIELHTEQLTDSNHFIIGKDLIISPNFPIKLLGEIVDAPLLSEDQLFKKIGYYVRSGIDVLDIGCIVGESHSDFLSAVIPKIKKKYPNLPISIDSTRPEEIYSAVEAGADTVLSVTHDNYHDLLDLPKTTVLVLIPLSEKFGGIPRDPQVRVEKLIELHKTMVDAGFNKLFLDPITDSPISPGLLNSLHALTILRKYLDENSLKNQFTGLFMGLGNISELIDADSSGINTIMTLLAEELGVSAVLSTEYSNKSRNTLCELKKSISFSYFAKQKKSPPINLGIDAFSIKSKKSLASYVSYDEDIQIVAINTGTAIMDKEGYFKIYINHLDNQIQVTHFTNNVKKIDATKTYVGTHAESIYKEIITDGYISRLDHAAYLGKELTLAELALKQGSAFSQN